MQASLCRGHDVLNSKGTVKMFVKEFSEALYDFDRDLRLLNTNLIRMMSYHPSYSEKFA